jgi:hypothetical protein
MPNWNETDYRGVGVDFNLSAADKLNMMSFSNCPSVRLVSTRVEMPRSSELDRITDALERGMEETVEDLRRERVGWLSLAVERELLAELEAFMGDQSASDQTSSLSDLDWISTKRSILPRIGCESNLNSSNSIECRSRRTVFRHGDLVGAGRWRALSRGGAHTFS